MFIRLTVSGWCIKIAKIFLSARKLCRGFHAWEQSNFSYTPSYFSILRDCVEMFPSNGRFVGPLVDGESSDGSVNGGGKRIQILTVCSVFCFLRREQFS